MNRPTLMHEEPFFLLLNKRLKIIRIACAEFTVKHTSKEMLQKYAVM